MAASCSDRFIPSRSSSNLDLFHIRPESENAYKTLLRSALFGPDSANSNIFKFKSTDKKPKQTLDDIHVAKEPIKTRKVPTSAAKVYDVPGLENDFYLNLVDWSPGNVVAVGLGSRVHLITSGAVLWDPGIDDFYGGVCSVAWAPNSTHLAVGTYDGMVHLWDASRGKRIATMKGHRYQVGALSWNNSNMLSSGSDGRTILHQDIRTPHDYVTKMTTGHKATICGLKWSPDGDKLASSGQDRRVLVWNRHSTKPVLEYSDHIGSVRAIAWSPHKQGLLASGGGKADQCIRFCSWNTAEDGGCIRCVATGGQVCGLVWSKNVNEVVSSMDNEINVWKYPTMSKVATLTGHTCRVLYLADSPDGRQIATGAGDEDGTVRIWNVFPGSPSTSFLGFRSQIR